MTYLKPSKWYMRLINFTAKCQDLDIREQIEHGVKIFDLRIAFNENKYPCFAHGLMTYDVDPTYTLMYLNMESLIFKKHKQAPIWVRLMCERKKDEEGFKKYCSYIEQIYPDIKFFGGNFAHGDGHNIFKFPNNLDIYGKHASWNLDNEEYPKWMKFLKFLHIKPAPTGWYLDDLFPRIYAWAFNKKWRKKYGHLNLMQDFVGVY